MRTNKQSAFKVLKIGVDGCIIPILVPSITHQSSNQLNGRIVAPARASLELEAGALAAHRPSNDRSWPISSFKALPCINFTQTWLLHTLNLMDIEISHTYAHHLKSANTY